MSRRLNIIATVALVAVAAVACAKAPQEDVDAAKAEFTKTTGGKPYVSPLAKEAAPKTY